MPSVFEMEAIIIRNYIAFLRGINISGKNKIPMAELKKSFEELFYTNVKTYLNSGNVVFESSHEDLIIITHEIEDKIKEKFGLTIPVFVITKEALRDILFNAPTWWGGDGKETYHNLIFIIPPLTTADVLKELGEPKEGLETFSCFDNAIFWSFDREKYQKTNWWAKTATAPISQSITIRTANTLRKVADMS